MESKVASLEQQLQQLADETHAGQRDASRKLQEAAGSIRDNKIKEKIRYSKGMIQGQPTEYATNFEQNIGDNLEALKNKIGQAADAMGQASKQAQLARALQQTRELVRGAESLNQRAKQQGSQGSQGSQRSGGSTVKEGEVVDAEYAETSK